MDHGKGFFISSLFGAFSDPDEDIAGLVFQTSKTSTIFQLQELKLNYCNLISTSTPAGRSNFIKASTVLSVGSTMSIRRWCVRISN